MSLSSFVCTQLNGFMHCYLTRIILSNINFLFSHSLMVSSIAVIIILCLEVRELCSLYVYI